MIELQVNRLINMFTKKYARMVLSVILPGQDKAQARSMFLHVAGQVLPVRIE